MHTYNQAYVHYKQTYPVTLLGEITEICFALNLTTTPEICACKQELNYGDQHKHRLTTEESARKRRSWLCW